MVCIERKMKNKGGSAVGKMMMRRYVCLNILVVWLLEGLVLRNFAKSKGKLYVIV